MSSPLDKIEEDVLHIALIGATNQKADWFDIHRRDVLALVAVARAAEPFARPFHMPPYEDKVALRSALSRLGNQHA